MGASRVGAVKRERVTPRGFEMHFGSGEIVEEATARGPHHEASIQLLRFDDWEAAGTASVRFCYYSLNGRFQRSPLLLPREMVPALRASLRKTPKLRALLRGLVG